MERELVFGDFEVPCRHAGDVEQAFGSMSLMLLQFSVWSACLTGQQDKRVFLKVLRIFYGLPWWLRWQRILRNAGDLSSNTESGRFPWRREWLPTPVFLPGEFHGQRSLVGYSPWGH